ncbi:MAG: GSCFA domain-containing protein [Flavobacteriales bacterium]
MNPFFLNTPASKSDVSVSHQEHVLLLGSCFTENIGGKLTNYKFKVTTNPFGIIYNPVSLANALNKIIDGYTYTENDLAEHQTKYLSFDHHGSFSSFDKQTCLAKINGEIESAHQQLSNTKTIIITLGTAWVYELIDNNKIVANCHKIPAKNFTKRLLSVEEVVQSFSVLANTFKNIQFIFTVSPVRHISDGLHENNISKSVLHLAIHQLISQHKNCSYFSAYEMVMDELRDYRFFKEDMIHPTTQAIDYVWKKFADTYFSTETKTLNLKIEKLLSAVKHKPFDFKSEAHQKFIADQLNQMDELTKNYPFLDFEKEKREIQLLK